mgnify:FL=1
MGCVATVKEILFEDEHLWQDCSEKLLLCPEFPDMSAIEDIVPSVFMLTGDTISGS